MKLLALLASLFFATTVSAADISVVDIETSVGTQKYIYINGDIIASDVPVYENVRSRNPDVKGIWLNSNGGEVEAGVQLALQIYLDDLNTAVDEKCISICSVVFFAGDEKFITEEAYLAIHSAYYEDENKLKVRSDYANSQILYAFGYMRVAPEIAGLWINTPPDKLTAINAELNETLQLGITTMNLKPQ